MNEIALPSDINVITAQIKSYEEAGNYLIWEIGRRLNYVKENNLTHGNFSIWLEELGMKQDTANRYMKIVNELDGKYDSSRNLGFQNLYAIATLPEEERTKQHETSKGETKTPDQMTVRELSELKKQIKQKDERINALESAEPRVIEKRVEVPPADYYSLQRVNESLQREVETNANKLANVQSLLDLAQQKYRLLESESREAQELKANIDSLRNQKESLDKKVKATFEFNELVTEINQVFDAKMASLRFKPIVNELYDTEAPKQLTELVNNISFWVDEMRKIIPNDNMKIIEGELL